MKRALIIIYVFTECNLSGTSFILKFSSIGPAQFPFFSLSSGYGYRFKIVYDAAQTCDSAESETELNKSNSLKMSGE